MPQHLRALLKSRFLHFIALGALIAVLAPKEKRPDRIVIDAGRISDALRSEEARAGHPLSDDQRNGVVAGLVDDEVLTREALRLGLGTDDAVIRARLAERMRTEVVGPTVMTHVGAPRRRLAVWFASTEGEATAIEKTIRAEGTERRGARPPIPDGAVWTETELARVVGTGAAHAAFSSEIGAPTPPAASAWGFYVFVPLSIEPPSAGSDPSSATKQDADLERWLTRARSDYAIEVRPPAGVKISLPAHRADGESVD